MTRLFGIALFAISLLGRRADLGAVQKIAGSVGFYTQDGKLVGEVKVGVHPHEAVLSNESISAPPDGRTESTSPNGPAGRHD